MVEGESYALEIPGTSECKRVTLLSKAASRRGRVKVRIQDPRAELEVPSRRVKAGWRDYRVGSLELIDTPNFDRVAWIARGGDVVERSDAPGFWIVRRVNMQRGRALVDGVLVGLRRREVIPVERLGQASAQSRPSEREIEYKLRRYGVSLNLESKERMRAVDEWSRASEPTPEARDIADLLAFSPTARMQYRWIAYNCPKGEEGRELRREVATQGRIRWLDEGDAGYLEGEYIRYSVVDRFEVVLFDDPSGVDDDIHVDRIVVLPGRRHRPGGGHRRNRASGQK
jgi:hypothetical protein